MTHSRQNYTSPIRKEQFDNLLDILGAPAHLEILQERQELLRFGASRVTYQHSEERLTLRIRLIRNGRSAYGTTGSLDHEAVASLRDHLEGLLAQMPSSEDQPGLPSPEPIVRSAQTYFDATEATTAQERVEWFDHANQALPSGATLGGSVVHNVLHHAVGNTTGLFRAESRTRAMTQMIGTLDDRSAYARCIHRDAGALQTAEALDMVRRQLVPFPKRTLDTGTYRAVLAPTAMITLLATFGHAALGATAYAAGTSAVAGRMGEQIASPLLTCADDGCDEAGLPTTFDCEGAGKKRVPCITNGVLTGVVHNSQSAQQVGAASTGHAVPPGWRFGGGPSPSHLVVAPGEATEDELIAACGSGLYVQRVDYVRVVHQKQTLVTGTTRDSTFWIDEGRITARLPQFRFTLKLTDVLTAILALGNRRERGEAVFMESIAVPAALVGAFPVDAVTS